MDQARGNKPSPAEAPARAGRETSARADPSTGGAEARPRGLRLQSDLELELEPGLPGGSRLRPRHGPHGRRGLLLWLGAGGVAGLVLAVGGLWFTLSYFSRSLPPVPTLASYHPPQVTRIFDRNGRLIDEVFRERRTVVPMSRIPRVLVLAVLAAEDADFYRHEGLDYLGIVRALWRNVVRGKATEGASTITQQIVKNLLLTPERTLRRKVRELLLARRLEQQLSKDEILFLYLNHINFGHGRYGVQEASRYYFGHDVDTLSLAEASLIAGVPQAPSRLAPDTHPEAARQRQRYVLRQLAVKRAEYWPDLSEAQIAQAQQTQVALRPKEARQNERAPEIVTWVKRVLREAVGDEVAELGGFRVDTTLDLELQAQARAALRRGLAALDKRQGLRAPLARRRKRAKTKLVAALRSGGTYDARIVGADDRRGTLQLDVGGHPAVARLAEHARYNPEGLPPSKFARTGTPVRVSIRALPSKDGAGPARARLELGPDGAVVVIDPRTRDVLALVGGARSDYGFNRATQALRQPGSAFKPFVYGVGLRSGRFTPASLVVDAPEVYDQWRPRNYENWNYQGAIRLREALARSINLVAIRVMADVTPPEVVRFATDLGITSELEPSMALALGASAVRPLELTNAYASFAAGGRWQPPRVVRQLRDASDEPLPLPHAQPAHAVMSPAQAYVLTSMLTSVVQRGTAVAARRLGRPAAGKTGTSNDARDTWFVGYTPSTVAGVWVGYDDSRPLGKKESGARSALPIWIDVMGAAEKGKPVVEFPIPAGVATARIDPKTGLLAYAGMKEGMDEVFVAGTVPTETARPPDVVDANTFLMEQFGTEP